MINFFGRILEFLFLHADVPICGREVKEGLSILLREEPIMLIDMSCIIMLGLITQLCHSAQKYFKLKISPFVKVV